MNNIINHIIKQNKMAKLEEKIKEDLKSALKGKDELKASVLRMLIADIKNLSIEKKEDLSEDEVQAAVKSAVKKRKDSIESYKSGGRDELAQKEEDEIKILEEYLPEQMGEDEVAQIVEEVISGMGEVSHADFGKVMGVAMGKLKGQADGNVVSKVVKEKLS